jgi:hypothetical protein
MSADSGEFGLRTVGLEPVDAPEEVAAAPPAELIAHYEAAFARYEYELSVKPLDEELEPLSFFTEASQEQRTTEHILPQHPVPLRQSGAQLVQDLHPHDRGPRGTHHGAIIANGNLYCPATPRTLLELGPPARDATPDQAAAHDQQTAELARHKLGKITTDDHDGYHRVMCPAAMGKIRCPLRPASMRLDRNRPEILTPPGHPPACCTQQTITVPPQICAKTAQKHDYPSKEHRKSYARRTGAERTFSTAKDPATNNIARGWTRLMGLAPLMLWLTCLLAVRNQRILTAWDARQADGARRAAAGQPPKTRRRRRKTLASMATAAPP